MWALLEDVENWPKWAPLNAKNRVISHTIVSRQDNVVICDEYEQAWLIKARHRDRYTLHPTERLDEEIIQGDLLGGIVITLRSIPEGTLVHVDVNLSTRKLWLRLLGYLLGSERILTEFWRDLFDQLASTAEGDHAPFL